MALGEELQGHDAEFEGAPRCIRPGIEHDSVSPTRAAHEVILPVAAEIECVRGHSILGSQLPGKEAARGDRMEAHAVGVIHEHAAGAGWIKPRFKILYEVNANSTTTVIEHRVRGWPRRCHDSVSVSHAIRNVVYLAGKPGKHLAYMMGVESGIRPTTVID